MKRKIKQTLCGVLLVCGMAVGAYALTEEDSLITLKYFTQYFLSDLEEQGQERAYEMLDETHAQAEEELERLQESYLAQASGSEVLESDTLQAREWMGGDTITLTTGMSFLLLEGSATVEHTGAVVDVKTGNECSSGSQLAANHRYLVAEDTEATITILSGGAQLGVQGSYQMVETLEITAPFYDVSVTDWFHGPVNYVYEAGLFSGMDEHHFAPSAVMNRAMLMTVLYQMAGAPQEEMAEAQGSFVDVPDTAWYAPYVKWAASQGITAGTGPDTFSPEQSITREQVVALLYSFSVNYQGKTLEGRADLSGYTDLSSASTWAHESLAWAVDAGILSSAASDRLILSPQKNASRAEVATMLRAYGEKIS